MFILTFDKDVEDIVPFIISLASQPIQPLGSLLQQVHFAESTHAVHDLRVMVHPKWMAKKQKKQLWVCTHNFDPLPDSAAIHNNTLPLSLGSQHPAVQLVGSCCLHWPSRCARDICRHDICAMLKPLGFNLRHVKTTELYWDLLISTGYNDIHSIYIYSIYTEYWNSIPSWPDFSGFLQSKHRTIGMTCTFHHGSMAATIAADAVSGCASADGQKHNPEKNTWMGQQI